MKRHIHSLQGITDGKYREARRMRRDMTDSERILWERVRRNQIGGYRFRRQHVIQGFIVDFYCHESRLVVEVDGGIHKEQIDQDRIRDEILKSSGISVLRISNDRIAKAIDEVVSEIAHVCNLRIDDS